MKRIGRIGSTIGFIMIFGTMAYIFLGTDKIDIMQSPIFKIGTYGGITVLILSSIVPVFSTLFGGRIKNGTPALGLVKSVKQTGTYVNEQPELELKMQVTEKNGEQFEAIVTSIVPLTQLAIVQENATIPVLVGADKKVGLPRTGDPQLSGEEMQSLLDIMAVKNGVISEESLEISKNGVESYATVKAMRPKNSLTAERVELELDLELTQVNQSIVSVTVVKTVPRASIDQLQPGRVISVIYLPQHPEKLVIKTGVDSNTLQAAFQGL